MANAKVHVKTSTSGRRYVEIDDVIKRRLEQMKKSRNGSNGNERRAATGAAVREDKAKSSPASPPDKTGKPATST